MFKYIYVWRQFKALGGADFGPQPVVAGCGPDKCSAGWAAGPRGLVSAERGGAGERNDIVAGGGGAGSTFSARAVFLNICALFVPISWLIT